MAGQVRRPKESERFFALLLVELVYGVDPVSTDIRLHFDGLTPLYPLQRITLETDPEKLSTRIIDLIAPIGKGQRGLIVAPPKAGKTILLKEVANSITRNHPEMVLMVLLIDERPEEVTDIERSVKGEVVSSTFDEPPENHVKVADMVLERAKRLVEHKHDVVILLDSITRLARPITRWFQRPHPFRVWIRPLHKPKRFWSCPQSGGRRQPDDSGHCPGGNGSRMDDVIFEEFKGTGNMELILDRRLAERRLSRPLTFCVPGRARGTAAVTGRAGNDLAVSQGYQRGHPGTPWKC